MGEVLPMYMYVSLYIYICVGERVCDCIYNLYLCSRMVHTVRVYVIPLHPHRLIKSLEEAKVQAALQVKNLEGELVCSRQKVSELVQETGGLKMTNEAMKK